MVSDSTLSTAKWKRAGIALAVTSALCLCTGVALPYLARSLFSRKLAEMLPISPNSITYSAWVSSELRFQVWMWNVTNAMAVLETGVKPDLRQVGPFTFKELRTRESVQFYDNNTVGFDDVRTYYYLPEESVGSMANYSITNVNLPYLGVALRTRDKSPHIRKIINSFLVKYSGRLFVTRTVEELLLGYEDTGMVGLGRMVRFVAPGLQLPTRFGIMLGKNGTAKGSVLAGTGADGDLASLNRIQLWNGRPSLNLWRQDWANLVAGGTDGSMFAPPIKPDRQLLVFTPDLCRSANMTFDRAASVHGIPVMAFVPSPGILLNSSLNSHNAAFCTPRCLDSGVLNLSLCMRGAPVVASSPHFHGAPTYARAVNGVEPLARELETRLEIEPNTGLLLRAARRLQINVAVEPVEGYPDTEAFEPILIMPYLWLNESGTIGPEPAARFRQRVLWPLRLASLIAWLFIALGLATLILTTVVCCLEHRLKSAGARGRHGRPVAGGGVDAQTPLTFVTNGHPETAIM